MDEASEGVQAITNPTGGADYLKVDPHAIKQLAREAVMDIRTQFRQAPLLRQAEILKDPLATTRDRRVAFEFLQQACQMVSRIDQRGVVQEDVSHVSVTIGKGMDVVTNGNETRDISDCVTALDFNFDIHCKSTSGMDFNFSSSGRHHIEQLHQKVPAILTEKNLSAFLQDEIKNLPDAYAPYRFYVCVGGLSVEHVTKVCQSLSWHHLDGLPTVGNTEGYGYRDLEWEHRIIDQWGFRDGFMRHFLSLARVVRLPRHGASCPVAIIASSIDDKKASGLITKDGVFVEELEQNPA